MHPLSSFQNVESTLIKGVKQLEKYHYVLNAGTALGLYRDKDFIPSDTDVDVVILTEEPFELGDLEGFKQFQNYDNQGIPVQRCFQDLDNKVIFDVYFYYPRGDKAVSPYTHDLIIPLHLYKNRKELETKYGRFYFPNPIEDYLLANYGDDWMIPSNKKGIFA